MDRRKLVTLTLFLSTLAVFPLSANVNRLDYTIAVSLSEHEERSFSEKVASFLEKKGLESDAASRLSKKLFGQNRHAFEMQLHTLMAHCPELKEDAIVAYLSEKALHQSTLALDRYGDLVSMVTTIEQKALDADKLKTLSAVARINRTIYS